MSIHILEPRPGKRIALIEVPDGIYHRVDKNHLVWIYEEMNRYIKLPDGKWKLIGVSTDLTEEQCSELVIKTLGGYKNYNRKSTSFKDLDWDFFTATATESFASFMAANGFVDRNNDPDNERVKKYLILLIVE